MNRKIVFSILMVLLLCLSTVTCFADNKTVQLGDTGITCQVDSAYDVITSSNKKEYSQQLQAAIINDNVIVVYSADKGTFAIYYDQGKNFEQYDFANRKADDIQANYKDYVGSDLSQYGYSDDYEVSVYDSGKAKWLKLDFDNNILYYLTIQGKKSVSFIFYPQTFKNATDANYNAIIDSVNFGNPSLWDGIKSIAGKITNFGKSILGIPGAIIIWVLIGPSIVGFLIYIIILIVGIIASIFKKKN